MNAREGSLDWLGARLESPATGARTEAVVAPTGRFTYAALHAEVESLRARFTHWGLRSGDCVAFAGDYSLTSCARFLATLLSDMVAIPIAAKVPEEARAMLAAAPVDWFFPAAAAVDTPPERAAGAPTGRTDHPLLAQLRSRGAPGVVIMTSGSTGRAKVILHDATKLLGKFRHPRAAYRLIAFLLPDHMGGVNTLFGCLTSGGTILIPGGRDPETVCEFVAAHRADLLPVTPSFLTLLLASGAAERHDLSSLRVVSYGTEVIQPAVLDAATRRLPGVRFLQLYGSSELGIFRGRSQSDASPFVRLAGAEFRVQDGRLWVRGADSMLGYLSGEESGFDAEGWYDTGDLIEPHPTDPEFVRILGRASELINVGGQKVFPAEVEACLAELPGVLDAAVFGESNALTGQIVVARVQLSVSALAEMNAGRFRAEMRTALRGRLEGYKIPARVELTAESLVGGRLKKLRRPGP